VCNDLNCPEIVHEFEGVPMNQNVTQQLIEAHLVDGKMIPGDEIGLRIDQTLTQDATGTMVMLEFEAMGIPRVKTEVSAQSVDHNLLQTDFKNADDHLFLLSACKKFGGWYSRPGNGVSHPVHMERFGKPGRTSVQASLLFAGIGGDKVPGTFSDNSNLKRIDPLGYQKKLYRGCTASALRSVKGADEISHSNIVSSLRTNVSSARNLPVTVRPRSSKTVASRGSEPSMMPLCPSPLGSEFKLNPLLLTSFTIELCQAGANYRASVQTVPGPKAGLV
jgi:hypothetical protein